METVVGVLFGLLLAALGAGMLYYANHAIKVKTKPRQWTDREWCACLMGLAGAALIGVGARQFLISGIV